MTYSGERGFSTHTFPVDVGQQNQKSIRETDFRDVQERLSKLHGDSYQLVSVHGFAAIKPKELRRGVQFTKRNKVKRKGRRK